MLFRILGPVGASGENGEVALGGPRHRKLLATLLADPGRAVPSERLIEALWADAPPRGATAMLHVRISELRKLLRGEDGPELIRTRRPGYLLDVEPGQVDAYRFEQLAVAGRHATVAGDAATAAARLAAALALWRGPALADLADRLFAQPEIARLESLRAQVLQDRIGAELAAGRHHDVIAELEALVRVHPLHEQHRLHLMLALYRCARQSEALAVYRDIQDRLRDELGVDPGDGLQALQLSILRHEPGLTVAFGTGRPRARSPELPVPLASFVGRQAEVAGTCKQLADARLVTLSGVGGSGKTRLALQVALARPDAYPDGVWIVELAAVGDQMLIASTIAAAVGVRERRHELLVEGIAERLRATTSLLVLDNCEHLLDGVAEIARQLLGSCPTLRILCTSRERLGITGEVVCPVPGLAVPAEGERLAVDVRTSAAVRLFVERACAVQPSFRLTDDNAAAVGEIARRLDGLPLSIELAAARTTTFAPAQIAARLEDRFTLLSRGGRETLPRHRSLRAVVDWSYGLLTDPEQRFFAAVAVFVGGFTLDAAQSVWVAPGAGDPADLLTRLVEKSLVVAEAGAGEYRYQMLETLRAYGLEKLDVRSETQRVRDAHAAYYRGLATQAAPGLCGADLPAWLDRLRAEHGNLRAATGWSLQRDHDETAAEIAASLYHFWDLHGHYREGRDWLRRVLADGREPSPSVRARSLMGEATLGVVQGDLTEAAVACSLALALNRDVGSSAGVAHALQLLGFIALCAGKLDRARPLLDESLRTAAAAGAEREHGWALFFRSVLAMAENRFAAAADLVDRAETVVGPAGDPELLAWVSALRGAACWGRGQARDGARHLAAAIKAFHDLGGQWGLTLSLLFCALVLAGQDTRERAAVRLLGSAERLREAAGIGMLPFVAVWFEDGCESLRSRIGPEAAAGEWDGGQRMSAAEAVRMAHDELAVVDVSR